MLKSPLTLAQLKDSCDLPAPRVSFEFFPPKTAEGEAKLQSTAQALAALAPRFMSVTYGAGGSTRDTSYAMLKYIKEHTSVAPAAHLTCVNATKVQINDVAKSFKALGVNHIVALRGDPPGMTGVYEPYPDGYAYTVELVASLKQLGFKEISVAAFPEVHPEAKSPAADLAYLKEKIDAGADRAITQYCFDTTTILKFLDKAHKKGISRPIVPGIIMVNNFPQVVRFSQRCGATVPAWVTKLFEHTDNNPQAHQAAALTLAIEQCRLLQQHGITDFHFYTLNQPELALAVCHVLGVR